ncbi:MAG: tRNA guanosine(34) transglycosylase Tgt [Candidatus Niyogibacteria bacterium]|nr:tRNA guanosine(34) transglycosylase Tgt [Candidatus Niyogibacteria bacterium]
MISFKILKRSSKSRARLGLLRTPHGDIETPAFVPVATQATVKVLNSERVLETGTQLLIANTYHLHLRPNEKIIKAHGGLHDFMNWPRPLMTDSGGFQVFSLGFGKDLGGNKITKNRATWKPSFQVEGGAQPKLLKIGEDGVHFRSHIDGKELFIGPKESMRIQKALGADIIFAFDECPPPQATREYMKRSMDKTHRWAKISLDEHDPKQALFGIVQGGKFRDLRIESARFIGSLPFDGFGIGGEFGADKKEMSRMLGWVADELPEQKPRHLLGVGYPEDIELAVRAGMDTFDCITPTHYARRGMAYTGKGMLDLMKRSYEKDKKPVDPACACVVCKTYTRSYIHHLLRAREITPLELLTFHNLHFFNAKLREIREKIKRGKI